MQIPKIPHSQILGQMHKSACVNMPLGWICKALLTDASTHTSQICIPILIGNEWLRHSVKGEKNPRMKRFANSLH